LQMRLSNWSLTLGASMAWALGALYFDGMTSGLCSKPSTLRTSRVVRRGGGDPRVLNVFFALVLPVSVAQSWRSCLPGPILTHHSRSAPVCGPHRRRLRGR
jgi:hypothetical protein